MRDLLYSVAGVSTKSYDHARQIAEKTHDRIETKVIEHKEQNPRAGKYAGVKPITPYKAPYAE